MQSIQHPVNGTYLNYSTLQGKLVSTDTAQYPNPRKGVLFQILLQEIHSLPTLLCSPPHSCNYPNQQIVWQQQNACRSGALVENDGGPGGHDCGMVVGVRKAGWYISKTVDLLVFFCTTCMNHKYTQTHKHTSCSFEGKMLSCVLLSSS